MKTLPTSVSLLLARLRQVLRSLQAPVLVPIPIPIDRGRREGDPRRRHPGL